jgi:hypothetical protein
VEREGYLLTGALDLVVEDVHLVAVTVRVVGLTASRGRKRPDGMRGGTGGAFGRAVVAAGAPEATP